MQYSLEVRGDLTRVQIKGAIRDGVEHVVKQMLAELGPGKVAVDLSGVSAINSMGAKIWQGVLRALTQRGPVELHRCSAVYLDYCLLLRDFGAQQVISFYAGYDCSNCGAAHKRLVEVAGLTADSPLEVVEACSGCSAPIKADLSDCLGFLDAG